MNVVPVRPFGHLVKPAAALLATLALAAAPGAAPGPVAAAELFPGTPVPALRTLSINDPLVTEPVTGTVPAGFVVTLGGAPLPAGQEVTVRYQTADGTATAPGDYQPVDDTLRFVAGGPVQLPLPPVVVKADGDDGEGHARETFRVHLSQATNAFVGRADGTATIRDQQQLPAGGPIGPDPCANNDNPDSILCPPLPCGFDVLHPCPRGEARQAMPAPADQGLAPGVTTGGQPTVTTGGQPTAV